MISFEKKNRIMSVSAILAFLIYWISVFLLFPILPDQFPIHFDISGRHTRMVDKTWANWLLTPLILTVTAAILVTLMWRFISLGIEHYNFSYKNEVLKLNNDQKKPFEQAIRGFMKYVMWATVLYVFVLGIFLEVYTFFYVQESITLPILLFILVLTLFYLALIIWDYRQIKTTFRKELDSYIHSNP